MILCLSSIREIEKCVCAKRANIINAELEFKIYCSPYFRIIPRTNIKISFARKVTALWLIDLSRCSDTFHEKRYIKLIISHFVLMPQRSTLRILNIKEMQKNCVPKRTQVRSEPVGKKITWSVDNKFRMSSIRNSSK